MLFAKLTDCSIRIHQLLPMTSYSHTANAGIVNRPKDYSCRITVVALGPIGKYVNRISLCLYICYAFKNLFCFGAMPIISLVKNS